MAASKELLSLYESSLALMSGGDELAEFAKKVIEGVKDKALRILIEAADEDLQETLSLDNNRRILAGMETMLKAADTKLVDFAEKTFDKTYQQQFEGVKTEVSILSRRYPDTGITASERGKIEAMAPRLSAQLIRQTKDSSLQLIKSVTPKLKGDLQVTLAQGVLRGDSIGKMTKDLEGTGLQKGTFRTAEDRAKVIAITETTNIAGFARQEALAQVNENIDKGNQLERKVIAFMDNKTSDICRHLNLKHAPQDVPFIYKDKKYYYPAFHVKCRSQCIAWHPAWAALDDELGKITKQ